MQLYIVVCVVPFICELISFWYDTEKWEWERRWKHWQTYKH